MSKSGVHSGRVGERGGGGWEVGQEIGHGSTRAAHVSSHLTYVHSILLVVPYMSRLKMRLVCGGWGAGGVVVALDACPRGGLGAHAYLVPQNPARPADPSQAGLTAWL